jgi:uncharacterized protein (DUF2132 family)
MKNQYAINIFISVIFKYQVAGWDRLMTKITVKAKKKRAIKSSLFYLREIFTDMRSMNRYFGPIHG